jgi:hypothetical protein
MKSTTSLSLRRHARAFLVLAIVVSGCNAALGNDPATLLTTTSPEAGVDASTAAPLPPEAQGDAATTLPPTSSEDAALPLDAGVMSPPEPTPAPAPTPAPTPAPVPPPIEDVAAPPPPPPPPVEDAAAPPPAPAPEDAAAPPAPPPDNGEKKGKHEGKNEKAGGDD